MHLLAGQLGHRGVRVVVILAGLLDLRFERFLVLLRRVESLGGGVGLVLSVGGILIGLRDLGLGGDDLVVGQIVQLKHFVGQLGVGAGELLLELRLTLHGGGMLVLRVDQIGIRVGLRGLGGSRHQSGHAGRCGHHCHQHGLDHTNLGHAGSPFRL